VSEAINLQGLNIIHGMMFHHPTATQKSSTNLNIYRILQMLTEERRRQIEQHKPERQFIPAVATSMPIQREEEKQTSSDLVLSFLQAN
jgi:hypothetical protein